MTNTNKGLEIIFERYGHRLESEFCQVYRLFFTINGVDVIISLDVWNDRTSDEVCRVEVTGVKIDDQH